jgi:tRNA nucleotidyltransferase (CCA-adding enzyme)
MFKLSSFPKDLITIVRTIKKARLGGQAGYKCYVVGGGIRDKILKHPVNNWDLATNARPEQVTKLFKKVIPTGIKYGTVTVLVNKMPYEITTFRSDEHYIDGRHPSNVRYAKRIEDDLARRDFTVNAIAYDPLTDELIDHFGGLEDIKKKIIRAVGDPVKRFNEDGLRPMRACRFAAKLNFSVEPKTLKAISKCMKTAKMVSPERVHDEFMRMLEADKPSIGIELMRKSGLLKLYIPELLKGVGVKQPKQFHKWAVYEHAIYACDAAPKEAPILRLAALLHDISKPKCKVNNTFYDHENVGAETAEKIMRRLKFSNDHISYVKDLIRNHMFNYTDDWSDAAVRRFIKRVGLKYIKDLFTLRMADIEAMGKKPYKGYPKELERRINKIILKQNALHIKDLKVTGNDVMRTLGIPASPMVGKVLSNLLDKVIDDPKLNNKEILIKMMRAPAK